MLIIDLLMFLVHSSANENSLLYTSEYNIGKVI
jgi:hypothetical protein